MERAVTTEGEFLLLTSSCSQPRNTTAGVLTCFLVETLHFITRALQPRTTIAAGLLNAECFIIDNGPAYVRKQETRTWRTCSESVRASPSEPTLPLCLL